MTGSETEAIALFTNFSNMGNQASLLKSKKPRSPDIEETGFYWFVSIYNPHYYRKKIAFL